MFDDIKEFHTKVLKLERPAEVSMIDMDFMLERMRFMMEELEEFIEAGHKGDMVGVADALADIVYVALGTAWFMNLPMDQIWQVVHAANMKKVRGTTKRGNKIDAQKPEGWVGPEQAIAALILRRIDNE
jgi:predicted HAD superfamily Cof-like phosphohydrolase